MAEQSQTRSHAKPCNEVRERLEEIADILGAVHAEDADPRFHEDDARLIRNLSEQRGTGGAGQDSLRVALEAEIETRRGWAAEYRDIAMRALYEESGRNSLRQGEKLDRDTDRLQALLDSNPPATPVQGGPEIAEVVTAARLWLREEHGDRIPHHPADEAALRLHDALKDLDAVATQPESHQVEGPQQFLELKKRLLGEEARDAAVTGYAEECVETGLSCEVSDLCMAAALRAAWDYATGHENFPLDGEDR
jgi:hypothetical protein